MAFKMRGFNPGKGTSMGSTFMKKTAPYKAKGKAGGAADTPYKADPAYGGAGGTWDEYSKASGGDLDKLSDEQNVYEEKMLSENPNWNKRQDNTWKKRQNKINKHVGSKKVYEVEEENKPEVKVEKDGNKTITTTKDETGTEVKTSDPRNKIIGSKTTTVKTDPEGEVIKDIKHKGESLVEGRKFKNRKSGGKSKYYKDKHGGGTKKAKGTYNPSMEDGVETDYIDFYDKEGNLIKSKEKSRDEDTGTVTKRKWKDGKLITKTRKKGQLLGKRTKKDDVEMSVIPKD